MDETPKERAFRGWMQDECTARGGSYDPESNYCLGAR